MVTQRSIFLCTLVIYVSLWPDTQQNKLNRQKGIFEFSFQDLYPSQHRRQTYGPSIPVNQEAETADQSLRLAKLQKPALELHFWKPDRLPKGSKAFKPAPQRWTLNHEPVCSSLDSSYNILLASTNSSLPSWNGNYKTEGEGSRHWVFLTWVSICLRRLASKTRVGLTSDVPVLRQRSRVWFNVSMP